MYSIIGAVILALVLFKVSSLSSRVSKLEERLKGQVAGTAPAPISPQLYVPFEDQPANQPQSQPGAPLRSDTVAVETASNQVVEWLKNNWLSKLGVLLVLIGFGWFVSYAFVHNWIGPMGRILLGFGLGSVLALLGAWRIGKNAVQANILLVLGSAIVLLTAYASRIVYDFFTPEIVLALAFLVSAYITTLSAVFNREKLAVYGALVALGAPLLTHAPEPSVAGLFIYLAVVSVASVWVSVAKGWGSVNFAAIVGVLLYCLPFMFGSAGSVPKADKAFVVLITLLLALMYFVVNILQILRAGDGHTRSVAYIAVANSIFIFSVINALVMEELRSLVLAGWMIIFAIGSALVSSRTQQQIFFYIYSLVAILFLGVATAIELNGPVLTLAFTLEAALITILTFLVTKDLLKSAYMSLLMILPVLIAIPSLSQAVWGTSIFQNHALVVALVSALLLILGIFLMRRYQKEVHPEAVRSMYLALTWTGAFFAFSFVWLGTHATLSDNFATIVSLTVFTIVGIGTYLNGAFSDRKTMKYFGAVVLVLVIARLLIVDVWQMPLAPRIVVFIVVGVLLVSTSFIGRKKTVPPNNPPPPPIAPPTLSFTPPTFTPPPPIPPQAPVAPSTMPSAPPGVSPTNLYERT